MREGRASRTARSVALLRAIASAPGSPYLGVNDPLAIKLLGRRGVVAQLGCRSPGLSRALTFGLLSHVALRTATIDEAVRHHVRETEQFVILGAGLDARAFRMKELEDVDAFELDHPASQAEKRARLGETPPKSRSLRFVPIDFESESLHTKLRESGLDPSAPTLWIWEGVTPYLNERAIDETLQAIAENSAAGSVLIMSYATPEIARVVGLPDGGPLVREIIHAAFRALGEPLITRLTPEQAAQWVARYGFDSREDGGVREWGARFLKEGSPRVVIGERVLVAIKSR